MSTPTAIVTVRLTRLRQLPDLSGAVRPYVVANIGGFLMGRSRTIPSGATEFDLTAEPSEWSHETAVTGGSIQVWVAIRDDKGDAGFQHISVVSQGLSIHSSGTTVRFGSDPEVECEIQVRLLPLMSPLIAIPRVRLGVPLRARITPTNRLVVEITNIEGLYKPRHVPTGVTDPRRSEPMAGYISEDHDGRIFINRDLTGTWTKEQQMIKLSARVTARTGVIPGDAKVHWTITVPDNPFNTGPRIHRESGLLIDPGDYDSTGDQTGFVNDDNEDSDWPSGRRSHPWEAVSGYALSDTSPTEAKTAVVSDESQVVLHCPHVVGDRLMVRAEVVSDSTPVVSYGARTGIMTMWCRIDVEYLRMPSALALPVDQIPPLFEPCCVQLDVTPEQSTPDIANLAPNDDALSRSSSQYINRVFTHKNDPGWFCLIAAMSPCPVPSSAPTSTSSTPLYTGPATIRFSRTYGECFDIPGDYRDGEYVVVRSGYNIGFPVYWGFHMNLRSGVTTRLYVAPHDIIRDFTAGDGSLRHAYQHRVNYYPQRRERNGRYTSGGGYNMPQTVEVSVYGGGVYVTAGISPSKRRWGRDYFAGRTIIFTHHPGYYDPNTNSARSGFQSDILPTIAHEFVHAFGMPHKCGRYDYLTPRRQTCFMNYGIHWMVDDSDNLIPNSNRLQGNSPCALHLREVRRTHLEDNHGLRWR